MKKGIYTLIALLALAGGTASAQLSRTSYFMEGSVQRNAFNPAFRPYRGYVQIPGVGNLSLNYTSNALAVNNIFYPHDGKIINIFNDNIRWSDVEGAFKNSNGIDIDVSVPIIGFGFYTGSGFWSFETSVRTDVGFSIPREFFQFMVGVENGPQHYTMSDISVGANAYLTTSLGYSHRIFENLTVGARVNILGGLAHARIHYDRLDMNLSRNGWDVTASGNFEVAGPGVTVGEKTDENTGGNIIDFESIDFDPGKIRGLSGFGMTFDIGAEYTLLDRVKLSFSVLDMGFMNWSKKNAVYAKSLGTYGWDGKDLVTGEGGESGDVLDFMRFSKTDAPKLKDKVYATFVIGAEVDIFENNLLGFGLMYMNKKTQFVRRSEVSMALTVRPTDWFSASVSYALRNYRDVGDSAINSMGFALNFHPGWINFFIGTDYIISKINPQFIPVSQKMMNLHLGISVPLAKEKPQKLPKLWI